MNGSVVFQRLLLYVSVLASLTYCASAMWAKRHSFAVRAGLRFPSRRAETLWASVFLSALQSGKEDPIPGVGAWHDRGGQGSTSPKHRLSVAGDWLAPIIVWILVITMGMAIVGFLLGQR